MNLYELVQKQAMVIDEPWAISVRWSKGERVAAINEAAIRMNRDLKILYNYGSDSTVANQQEYSLPRKQDSMEETFEDMVSVIWNPAVNNCVVRYKSPKEFNLYFPQYGVPVIYTILPREQKIHFYRTPDTAAQTTTLGAELTASATSATIASNSGFGAVGRIKINSEVIGYTGTTTTTITGLTRGLEGTTAALHTNASTVTWRNLLYCYLVKPARFTRVWNTGSVVATVNNTVVTGTSTNWLYNVLPGDMFGYDQYSSTTQPAVPQKYYEIDSVSTSIGLYLKENYHEATIASSSAMYGIGQPSPFPEAYDEALIKLSGHLLLLKDDDPKAPYLLQEYQQFCSQRVQDTIPADYLPISGGIPVDGGRISLFNLPAGYPLV